MNADVEAAWHSDGDACTGIHCGNPEHGYAIRAEGLDVDAARAAILLKAAFNAIDTLEAAIRAALRERIETMPNPYDEGDEHTIEAMLAIGFEKGRAAALAATPAEEERT